MSLQATIPRRRVSVPDLPTLQQLLSLARSNLAIVDPRVPVNFLDIIEKFCLSNPDFSQVLSHYVNMGNTGHELSIVGADEATIEQALNRLNVVAARINTDDLVNHLLRQVGINGAVSLEWVAQRDLSGIERAVLVPVSTIRFKYDKGSDRYTPFQYDKSRNDYIALNETTYVYIPLETTEASPYAIPPFLAALPTAIIQLFIMDNLKFVIKKLGLLGLISVAAEMPDKEHGETDDHYRQRLSGFLNELATNFSENYREGIIAHFDNMKIEHNAIAADARGAKDIIQVVEEQIASGLKIDPAMLGRTYSTTETYAGVVYARMIENLNNIRRLVKRAIEKGYKLDLYLSNIPVEDVSLHFNPNEALNPRQKAETEKIEVEATIEMLDAGLISPDEAARRLGYDRAYSSEFMEDKGNFSLACSFKNGAYHPRRESISVSLSEIEVQLEAEATVERRRLRWVNVYLRDVFSVDGKVRDAIVRDVETALKTGEILTVTPELFSQGIYTYLLQYYPEALRESGIEAAIAKSVNAAYRFYRTRDRVAAKGRVPVRFTEPDHRAIRFVREVDDFHFSKFLENESAKGPMLKFLEKEFEEKGHEDVKAFTKRFAKHFGDISQAQMRRIVDTSVARIRCWGHIRQMSEMHMATAEVSEVMDRITCDVCEAMHGKRFSVKLADDKIRELSALSSQQFANRVYDNAPPGWKNNPVAYAEANEVETFIGNDIVGPPWHPHCRGRLVVSL